MKKYFICAGLIIIGVLVFVNFAKADGLHGPLCAFEHSDANGKQISPTCKIVYNNFQFILSDGLNDKIVILLYRRGARFSEESYEKYNGKINCEGSNDCLESSFRIVAMTESDFSKIFKNNNKILNYGGEGGEDFNYLYLSGANFNFATTGGQAVAPFKGEKIIGVSDIKNYLIPFENIKDGLLDFSGGVIVLPMYTTPSIINPLKSKEYQYTIYGFDGTKLSLQETKKTYYFGDGTKQEWNFDLPGTKNVQSQVNNSNQEKINTTEAQSLNGDKAQTQNSQHTPKRSIFTMIADFFRKIFRLK